MCSIRPFGYTSVCRTALSRADGVQLNSFLNYLLPEPVPDTPDCFNTVAGLSKFFPETIDLYINGTWCNHIIISSDVIDDLLSGKHPAGFSGQKGEDHKFGGGQVDLFSVKEYFMPSGMDLHGSQRDHPGFFNRVRLLFGFSAQYGFNPGKEHPGAERLGDISSAPDSRPETISSSSLLAVNMIMGNVRVFSLSRIVLHTAMPSCPGPEASGQGP